MKLTGIQEQILLIEKAMKSAGVWSHHNPEWVEKFRPDPTADVWQWLQFVYLPMRMNGDLSEPHYLAPVISPLLTSDTAQREILQLVIELDNISSTLERPDTT